ncbi:MAG: MogA/MoaB family molybdenum cofactor biosynthesis protein [Candidatus Omnitrophota bacterium]|nr:MAG: MogA/MoaB family molybdenum cofactor biosynthesis protein [Candidatus Omnitrophota bacterium]
MIKTAILTISDSRTKDTDLSGKAIMALLKTGDFTVCNYEIVKDVEAQIKDKIIHCADSSGVDLVLTTGGTGFGPRDLTPQATLKAIDKRSPGISELIRAEGFKKTKQAALSRGEAGIRKNTLIINLPGSVNGAKESLLSILEIIPHAIDMMKGKGH